MVWPMVPAGVSNDEIMYARGLSPTWDRGEEELPLDGAAGEEGAQ